MDRNGNIRQARPARRFAVLVVGLALVASVIPHAQQTDAGWIDPEHAQGTLSAGVLPRPGDLTCVTSGGGLLGTSKATISWDPVASLPAGAKYEVVLTNNVGTAGALPAQNSTTITIVPSLLDNLIGLLLTLVTPPTVYEVSVSVVYPGNEWRSAPSNHKTVKYSGSLAGLLGGFSCG